MDDQIIAGRCNGKTVGWVDNADQNAAASMREWQIGCILMPDAKINLHPAWLSMLFVSDRKKRDGLQRFAIHRIHQMAHLRRWAETP